LPRSGVFTYPPIERVVYASAFTEAVAAEAERAEASRVFILASGTLRRETDAVERAERALGDRFAGLFDRFRPHVQRDDVIAATETARKAQTDLIVTIGGGTVTDGAKMVALCLANEITEMHQLDGLRTVTRPDGTKIQPEIEPPTVRVVSVPTTLSGGEFNVTAGSTDPVSRVKHSFRHPYLAPRAVILDPAITRHTPEWLWLSTGIRAVDHAVEDICSIDAQPYVDGTAAHALRLLGRALPHCKRNADDLDARLDCQIATWLSMAGVAAGVSKGACHGIGHMLGGTAGVPHGYTSCVMLPSVLRYNKPVNAERQALVSEALGHAGADAADVVEQLVAELGLPGRLRDVGIERDRLEEIAEASMHDRWILTNPRRITSPEQVMEILEMAW
jgi:maleylacetate reductase